MVSGIMKSHSSFFFANTVLEDLAGLIVWLEFTIFSVITDSTGLTVSFKFELLFGGAALWLPISKEFWIRRDLFRVWVVETVFWHLLRDITGDTDRAEDGVVETVFRDLRRDMTGDTDRSDDGFVESDLRDDPVRDKIDWDCWEDTSLPDVDSISCTTSTSVSGSKIK